MLKTIGILSMLLFTFSFIPQILRLLKTKQANDISLGLCFMLLGGYIFGAIYIWPIGDLILQWGYAAGLVLAMATVALAVYYRYK